MVTGGRKKEIEIIAYNWGIMLPIRNKKSTDWDIVVYQIFIKNENHDKNSYYYREECGMPENASGAKKDGAIIIKGLRWSDKHDGTCEGTCATEWRAFSSSGDCWQKTQIHGTFLARYAIDLATVLAESNPNKKFIVKEIKIKQTDEIIMEIKTR